MPHKLAGFLNSGRTRRVWHHRGANIPTFATITRLPDFLEDAA